MLALSGMRTRWIIFVGSFVALALGVGLIAATGLALAATFDAPERGPERFAAAPVVVRAADHLRVDTPTGTRTKPLDHPGPVGPRTADRLAALGRTVADRTFPADVTVVRTGPHTTAVRTGVDARDPRTGPDVTVARTGADVGDPRTDAEKARNGADARKSRPGQDAEARVGHPWPVAAAAPTASPRAGPPPPRARSSSPPGPAAPRSVPVTASWSAPRQGAPPDRRRHRGRPGLRGRRLLHRRRGRPHLPGHRRPRRARRRHRRTQGARAGQRHGRPHRPRPPPRRPRPRPRRPGPGLRQRPARHRRGHHPVRLRRRRGLDVLVRRGPTAAGVRPVAHGRRDARPDPPYGVRRSGPRRRPRLGRGRVARSRWRAPARRPDDRSGPRTALVRPRRRLLAAAHRLLDRGVRRHGRGARLLPPGRADRPDRGAARGGRRQPRHAA